MFYHFVAVLIGFDKEPKGRVLTLHNMIFVGFLSSQFLIILYKT